MNVIKLLLSEKPVSFNLKKPFRYASGILSPIYCDNRLLLTNSESRNAIIESFIDLIKQKNLKFAVVCGVATAGIAWGVLITQHFNCPFIYVRSGKKEHGKQNSIECKLEKGRKVLVVEDLVSTGGSSIKAIESVREAGGIVFDCVAIFSYGMPVSKSAFSNANCNLYAITNLSELLEFSVKEKIVSKEQKNIVDAWILDTKGWGKKFGFE
jgi:orotate phosphoribosyltransferase